MTTHCKHGHLLAEVGVYEYTYPKPRGTIRMCKACTVDRARARAGIAPARRRPRKDWRERLWGQAYVNRLTGCVIWMGACTKKGYGQIQTGGKWLYVHRLAYELQVGPIPPDMTVDHLCWNPRCMAGAHLELCTAGENSRRRAERS